MWVRNPFLPLDSHVVLNLKEEELIDIRNDGDFKLMHKQMPLAEFCMRVQNEYPCVEKKAIVYFCFSFPRHTYVRMDFPL